VLCDSISLLYRSELSQEQRGELNAGAAETESHQRDAQEMINSLMQKLSAAEEDAFLSRCRYSVIFINALAETFNLR